MWKLHAKLLKESWKVELELNEKTKAFNLKIGLLVFAKDNLKRNF